LEVEASAERDDAFDGEEITNKIPASFTENGESLRTQIGPVDEMCPIHRDFKHFHAAKTKQFRHQRKVSSIMRAKALSIMPANAAAVTAD